MSEQLTLREYRDIGGDGFDVGNDVGGEDDDALARKLGEKIAEANALFRIKAGSGFIHNEQLRIIEKCLGDADALTHAAGKSAERTIASIGKLTTARSSSTRFLALELSRPLTAAMYCRNSMADRWG